MSSKFDAPTVPWVFPQDLAVGRHGPGFRDAEGWSLAGKIGISPAEKGRKTLEM